MVLIRQGRFLSSQFLCRLLFRWKLLWGLLNLGSFWTLGFYLPEGPPQPPSLFLSTASPLLVLLAHSEPDFLARHRLGCPQQLFLPSPELDGHRCCQQEAVFFQVTQPRKWDPSRPSHPARAGAYCLPAALAHGKVGGVEVGQKGNFPESQGSQP